MKNINTLARQEIVDMVPYQSARRLEAGNGEFNSKIWLNANEASGPGIYSINGDCINRYPDFQPKHLIDAYSQYCGLNKENILATRGADEGIELIIRTFCRAYQDNILICPPTYGMYAISAENHGAGIVKVPLIEQQLDVNALEQQVGKVKVVFLCSPGNPTGNLLNKDDIIRTIELFADTAIVVVDEAYIEFSPQNTAVNLLAKYPNVVVLRTLSKAFALAGLRCGFTLANTDTITLLSKVIAPYPVPAPIAEIASEVLSNKGLEQVKVRVQETVIQRNSLASWLNEQTWCEAVFNSDANFVLFRCANKETKNAIFNTLTNQGILIRDQSKQMQLEHCLRISIGSERELSVLKQTLTAFSSSPVLKEVVE
ncbi:histidinol-phosphate transaminase [Thalassotalea hakodatensis]|uniref:histidinol-phosphate transaminase n=1 Tax=Thalassotalea hakodatensis TaxID=3030492 RepID=UPI002574071E|nr:histidinol-phosphate transaminase [Thalassotalea hakodatensis]